MSLGSQRGQKSKSQTNQVYKILGHPRCFIEIKHRIINILGTSSLLRIFFLEDKHLQVIFWRLLLIRFLTFFRISLFWIHFAYTTTTWSRFR